jgi:hypothetical protein
MRRLSWPFERLMRFTEDLKENVLRIAEAGLARGVGVSANEREIPEGRGYAIDIWLC